MKAIIFDFDGVIHNTFELAYAIELVVLDGHLTRDEYRDYFNGNIYNHKTIIRGNVEEFFRVQNEAFNFLEIEKETKNILVSLEKKYELFIISSNQEIALKTYLQNNKISSLFKAVLGLETHKSKVEKFKSLFHIYGFVAEDCVFVTDTLGDILEGNKVGVKTIAVDFGFHDRERLKKGNPYKIVSSFEEIVSTIEEI